MMNPLIAIVGRPNVGKSTLFNRLIRQQKAIVIDEPGATRDRNYADCRWFESPFTLIDTGGFEPASTTGILSQMREQTMLAVEEADAVIFMMDAREGLTPTDQDIAKILRTTKKKTFYAVNKIDGPRHEALLAEFYRLGIEHPYPVSAQHGIGIDSLMNDVIASIPQVADSSPPDQDIIRLAVVGKPNVGKSSLVNRILGFERSIANAFPGTTRDAIDTPFAKNGRKFLLIDTAGIRRKSRISLTLEKYSIVQAIRAIDRADIALLMIDAVEGLSDQDRKIAGLVLDRGTACILIINKWDLIKKNNDSFNSYTEYIRKQAKFLDFVPMIFVSASSGQRVEKIFPIVERVYEQYCHRIETADLNKRIREITERNPPPGFQGKPHFFKYITQVSTKPPTFTLFLRGIDKLHFSYERYLTNRIRETFGFGEVPIRIFLRTKNN
jgi:GTPase